MLTYQEYEESVYNWLIKKNKHDPEFTFSFRRVGSTGAKADYFIGTEKSNYLGLTLWTIPVSYPGSSGDLITLKFKLKSTGLKAQIEIDHTIAPKEGQNQYALDLAHLIKEKVKRSDILITRETDATNKYFGFYVSNSVDRYEDIDKMLLDFDLLLNKFIPIVNEAIAETKKQHPDFVAHRITQDELKEMKSSTLERREKHINSEENQNGSEEQKIYSDTNITSIKDPAHPLNQVLCGHTGTGKTYFTKNTALEIIGLEPDNMDRSSIQKEFDKGLKDGRIVFTTFHQSMSYEDFIEGIKPVIDQKDDSDEGSNEETVKYEIVDGIFKEACENAKVLKEFSDTDTPNYFIPEEVFEGKKFFKLSLGNTLNETGDIIYDFCKENNYIGIGWGSDVDYTGVKSRKEILGRLTESGVEASAMDFNVSAIERFVLWMRKGDVVFVSHGNRQLKAVGIITGDYEFKESEESTITGYNHFRKVEWKILDAKIPVGKVYEKNFSQQSIYELYNKDVKTDLFTKSAPETSINDNYVIIIDEINRGNVSQIFGELITLIEEDKRSGKEEAIEVTLPYSKTPFSVPPNLYIIGTMNTADRSVEALDTALRRRFSFQEMMPNPELLNEIQIEGINLERLLRTINERIEILVDRDHTIGHSYFLNVQSEEDLKDVFKDKVIPLLQEYFFGDYSKMEMVIGSYFFKKELPKVTFAVTNENYYEERKRYVFKDFDDADFDIITALKELLLIKEQVAVES